MQLVFSIRLQNIFTVTVFSVFKLIFLVLELYLFLLALLRYKIHCSAFKSKLYVIFMNVTVYVTLIQQEFNIYAILFLMFFFHFLFYKILKIFYFRYCLLTFLPRFHCSTSGFAPEPQNLHKSIVTIIAKDSVRRFRPSDFPPHL